MAIKCDYHMHSSYSGDSDTPMENMVKKAIDLGLKYICFTEHQDFDFIYKDDEPKDYFEVNTDQYLYDLILLKEKYESKISICFGIELGMQQHLAEHNTKYALSHDFDFIIGSSHLCDRQDPYFPEFFQGRDEKEAYHQYFSAIYECIKSCKAFDVYGHLDYVLRYGPTKNTNFKFEEYKDIIDKILTLLIESGKGIEVNTSGYTYGMNNPHPCRDILLEYKNLGGEILTIGSDAHKPEHIANEYHKVENLLKECGFKYYTIFDKRLPVQFKL